MAFRNLIHNAWRGIKDIFDFKVPEEVVRVRETKWDDFFERYSKEASDEIDLNVDILEPEEEEEDEESEVYHSFGQRLPIRTPTSLIQYWINTGNPPCKALLDKNALSEDSGSSLSEKESSPPNAKNENNKQKTDSSCSSVDTAVYILSNANVTKKADTIAIIAGAKNVNSTLTENRPVDNVENISNVRTKHTRSAVSHAARINKNIDVSDNDFCSLSTVIASTRVHDKLCGSSSVDTNVSSDIQSKKTLSRKNSDEVEVPSQKSARTDDSIEGSIARCVNKTTVPVANYKTSDDDLDPNKVLEKDSSREEQAKVTNEDESSFSHRKKLYTGRDSPIDLLQTKVHSISRLSNVSDIMHPALDTNDIVRKKIFKNKTRSLFNKYFRKSSQRSAKPAKKKRARRKRSPVKNIADSDGKVTRSNEIQDSVTDDSSKCSSESQNSDRHHSVQSSPKDGDATNVPMEKSKPDLASVNLNPMVVLTRLRSSNESSKHVGSPNARKSVNNQHSRKTEKLYARGVEDLDGEAIESDDNTILICQCEKTSASQTALLSNNCSGKSSRVSIVTEQKTASKKVRSSNSLGETEPRVVLEQLSLSVLRKYTAKESKVSRKDTAWQKEALKLPEVKVRLERLPANMCRKRGDNIAEEKNSSDSSSPRDSKRKSQRNRGSRRRVVREVTDDESEKFEENDETMLGTNCIVDKRVNQMFDNAESNFAHRSKTNDARTSRNKRRKYSILNLSSDETSLNESLKPSKKRSKISGKTNERSSRDKTVFDMFGSMRNTRGDKRVHFSASESSNTSSSKVNRDEKRSPFSADTTNSISCSDTTEMNGTRCKDDVSIVLFQTKTYETDSSESEIYNTSVRKELGNRRIWKDSSSLSSSGEKQRAASGGTCNREDVSSSSGEEESHDDASEVQSASTPKKTSSSDEEDDLVSRRKEQPDGSVNAKISYQRNNNVESTGAKLITFQTKTFYDSDSSE